VKVDAKGETDMFINFDMATARQTDMLREAEQARLVKSVMNHHRPLFRLKLPFVIQWKDLSKPVAPDLRECTTSGI